MWSSTIAGTREEDRSPGEWGEEGEALASASKLTALLSHRIAPWSPFLCQPGGTASASGVMQDLCACSQNQGFGDNLCLRTSQNSHLCH